MAESKTYAFLLQTPDMKWTVYTDVDTEQDNPLKTATIAEEGICLFSDAVDVANKRGYGSNRIAVQYVKQGKTVS